MTASQKSGSRATACEYAAVACSSSPSLLSRRRRRGRGEWEEGEEEEEEEEGRGEGEEEGEEEGERRRGRVCQTGCASVTVTPTLMGPVPFCTPYLNAQLQIDVCTPSPTCGSRDQ